MRAQQRLPWARLDRNCKTRCTEGAKAQLWSQNPVSTTSLREYRQCIYLTEPQFPRLQREVNNSCYKIR